MQTSSLTKGRVSIMDEAKAFSPTALTLSRMMLLPIVIGALCFDEKLDAFLFFFVAELTDYFDGRLARRFHVATQFGALLDTMADKVFHLPLFFYFLVYPRPDLPHLFLYRNIPLHTLVVIVGILFFALILLIEVMLMLSRTSILERWRTSASNKASVFGQAKTWIHAFTIGGYIIGTTPTVTVGQLLLVPSVIFGLLSLASRIRFIRTGH